MAPLGKGRPGPEAEYAGYRWERQEERPAVGDVRVDHLSLLDLRVGTAISSAATI